MWSVLIGALRPGRTTRQEIHLGPLTISAHCDNHFFAATLLQKRKGYSRSDNASRSDACGWHWITLVPTARLELAQLSPLPPQDSVSTNFTTSALYCNPGKLLLNCRESLQDLNYNWALRIVQRTKCRFRENSFCRYLGTSAPGADDATGAEPGAAAADAPAAGADAATGALPRTPAETCGR